MLLETIYFTAPAWLSNTLAAFLCYFFRKKKILLMKPMDFGFKIKGKRFFGDNKTICGCLITLISASLIGLIQNQLFLGFIMGLSVIVGTLLNSFLKRRLNIIDGGNFFPFDQVDYALSIITVIKSMELKFVFFDPLIFLIFVFIYQLSINLIAFKFGFINRFLEWKRA
ncbi:MAG: CDP-archaeol synthase [Patescibacteria group bacterium]|nr:CDP-archaeol synthase [Patescibacteria group bacterium]